ncbi:MAG: PorP/SprF family type IX secretion system membrane protein [Flavobacteriales bacterium]|nr:PorP/SprF family type IX secretion system membrane protein [Flavobacteriales bacterium]MBL4735916.1 PorP/SprF family type IX secretion system membrane protein [Flavobacteriales bacterium]
MFRLHHTFGLLILMGGFSLTSLSQEIQFSQYSAFPLYLNPAYTGNIDQQRVALTSRNQWVAVDGAFNTLGVAYDYNLKNFKSGVGLVLLQDESSGGGFSTFTAAGLYAYHLKINDQVSFNSGVRVSYIQQRLDPNVLTFTDQLIRNDGSNTYEVFDHLAHDYIDFSWGNVLFISDEEQAKNYWVGLSFDHLTKPEMSFNSLDGPLPVKFALHGGAEYRMSKNQKGFPDHVMTYRFLYKSQVQWDQTEIGATYIRRVPHKRRTLTAWKKTQPKFDPSYKQLKGKLASSKTPMPLVYAEVGLTYRGMPIKKYGPGYKNHESAVVLLGFNFYNVKVAYTFDFTISMLGFSSSGGAHEVSLIYKFEIPVSEKKEKKKKLRQQKALFDGV